MQWPACLRRLLSFDQPTLLEVHPGTYSVTVDLPSPEEPPGAHFAVVMSRREASAMLELIRRSDTSSELDALADRLSPRVDRA